MSGTRWERGIGYMAYAGGLSVLISLVAWLITRRQSLLVELSLIGGLALLALAILLRPASLRQALIGRRTQPRADLVIMTIAGLALVILANTLAGRHHARFDLTAEGIYSISDQTVSILRALKEPIQVTGFFIAADASQAAQQTALAGLLDEYRFYSDKIRYEFIDPQSKPALAKQYGIAGYGALVLEMGQRRLETYARDEQALTAAILKVSRAELQTIYFVTGHGERDPERLSDDGYAEIRRELERDNYRVQTLNLSAITDTLPADAAVLIVASPQVSFTQAERDLFIDYLYAGGRALVACDPGNAGVDAALLEAWGLRPRDDLVIDPTNAFFGDIAAPIATTYPWHTITKRMTGVTTFFPFARSLEAVQPAPAGMEVAPLVITGAESWGETSYKSRQQMALDAGEDVAGPLLIAAAVQETTRHGRLVVFGSSFFAANNILSSVRGEFGNSRLFVNAINWLTEDNDMLAIPSRQPQERRVTLSRAQANLVLYSSALLLPLAILVMGFAAWWANR